MTVVITGASRGIGQALYDRYSALDGTVIGTSRAGHPPLQQLDVTDPEMVASFGRALSQRPVELLICNAGIYPEKGQTLDAGYSAEMWAKGFATNVTGVFLTIQALLPSLRAAKAAKIAIISSQMASTTKAPGGSYIYRASKAAVLNLGRNLASDLRGEEIAVGIYHPGWVQTDMGGGRATITPTQSATGLMERFAALSPATTGCFETWDGQAHPF